jgi:hypothetical protein
MWWMLADAAAQQERCAPASPFALETRVAEVDAAFARGDALAGRELLGAAHDLARCVSRPVTPEVMARLASLEALGAHLDQDPDRALRWARAAEWSLPRHPWPAAIGTDHPIRAALAAEGLGSVAQAAKKGLRVPPDGAIVSSGRLLAVAEGPVDAPVLLQVCDRTGAVVRAEWIEGTAFPDDLLRGGGSAAPPSWWP